MTMTTEQLAALKEVAEKATDANHNAPNWFEYQAAIENFRAEWTPVKCKALVEEVERLRRRLARLRVAESAKTATNAPEAQPQGLERHRFQRGGRVVDQQCGECNQVADAPIHQMGDIERAAVAVDLPRAIGETTVEAALAPHKAINFLTALEHQAHRNHEYHPGHCAECTMTETIASKLREQLGLTVRATRTEEEGEKL